ncbi:uncharacterized protein DS421_14g456390 [Arachis hypogaea]|nr:uncharacterized protein DS421_14g456390 [Arachis hypogaea]
MQRRGTTMAEGTLLLCHGRRGRSGKVLPWQRGCGNVLKKKRQTRECGEVLPWQKGTRKGTQRCVEEEEVANTKNAGEVQRCTMAVFFFSCHVGRECNGMLKKKKQRTRRRRSLETSLELSAIIELAFSVTSSFHG